VIRYLPWVFGGAFTILVWVIGAYAAKVSTVTCLRFEAGNSQGYCQLRESTVFRPWVVTTTQVALGDIRRATVKEDGAELYTVLLLLHQDRPPVPVSQLPDRSPQEAIAAHINTFLHHPETPSITIQTGGSVEDIGLLIVFLGLGPLFAGLCQVMNQHRSKR